jgi:hypothetical protein
MPRWKPRLESYRASELSLLTFGSDEDIDTAIEMVWVGKLQGMPFNLAPDGDSLVVPANSIPYFTKAGLRFSWKQLSIQS